MYYTKLLLVVLIALPCLVSSSRTKCERIKSETEIRCVKDGYGPDKVHIKNIANTFISFKLAKWMSYCGKPGVNYLETSITLTSGNEADVEFCEAAINTCNELFVYECKRDNIPVKCYEIVSVYPLLESN